MKKLIPFLLSILFFLSCNNNSYDGNAGSNKLGLDTVANTYAVTAADHSMNLSIARTKKTISEFDQALKSNNPLYTDFAVKKRYNTADGGGEHMWIESIQIENGHYKGMVNNSAEKTTEVKYGDTVLVTKDDITDWMYIDDHILKGGYTIRAIRNQLNKEQRIKMDRELDFIIKDQP
jgi:uncharacterized protein YegJ (DUF2314 family)